MLLFNFDDYQIFVKDEYDIVVADCAKQDVLPLADQVENYVLSIYTPNTNCTCNQEIDVSTFPAYVTNAVYKGVYVFDSFQDVDDVEEWKRIVYQYLKFNGGIIVG